MTPKIFLGGLKRSCCNKGIFGRSESGLGVIEIGMFKGALEGPRNDLEDVRALMEGGGRGDE